jgi:hypothetical protein
MDSKKLRYQYMKILPKLEETLKRVDKQISSLPKKDFVIETNLKPFKSVKRKAERDEVDEVTELSDLARGRIFFSTNYNYNDVVALIKKLLKGWIKNIDVKFDKGHGLEYHGVFHVDLDVDGTKFELQLMPIEFKPYKEALHKIYEKFRDPDNKLSEEEKEKLRKLNNKVYEVLDRKARNNRRKNHAVDL